MSIRTRTSPSNRYATDDDDDDVQMTDAQQAHIKDLGNIRVEFYRRTKKRCNKRKIRATEHPNPHRLATLDSLPVIPEKALKGRSANLRAR
jgi:hypothetical protein